MITADNEPRLLFFFLVEKWGNFQNLNRKMSHKKKRKFHCHNVLLELSYEKKICKWPTITAKLKYAISNISNIVC